MSLSIGEYAAGMRDLAERVTALAEQRPNLRVQRNEVGNLVLHAGSRYVGWIDVREGGLYLEDGLDPLRR